mgnify:CR=1 FL=1
MNLLSKIGLFFPIPYPADPADTKRQLLIFLLVAYGVTYAMGILTWYGSVVLRKWILNKILT